MVFGARRFFVPARSMSNGACLILGRGRGVARFWSAGTCHRFDEATCRRRMSARVRNGRNRALCAPVPGDKSPRQESGDKSPHSIGRGVAPLDSQKILIPGTATASYYLCTACREAHGGLGQRLA